MEWLGKVAWNERKGWIPNMLNVLDRTFYFIISSSSSSSVHQVEDDPWWHHVWLSSSKSYPGLTPSGMLSCALCYWWFPESSMCVAFLSFWYLLFCPTLNPSPIQHHFGTHGRSMRASVCFNARASKGGGYPMVLRTTSLVTFYLQLYKIKVTLN